MKNIVVLYGGKSVEHDVSVITGVLTLNSIDNTLFTVTPIYIDSNGVWYTGSVLNDVGFYKNKNLKKLKKVTFLAGDNTLYQVNGKKLKKLVNIDCAINCTHGKNGEDGTIYGMLCASNVAVLGSEFFSSSMAMDKEFTKFVLSGLNIRKLTYVSAYKSEFYSARSELITKIQKRINYPLIVKPSRLGSSIGISKVRGKEQLVEALATAFKYDDKVIIEPCILSFKEINCVAYKVGDNIVVSECEQCAFKGDILSFKDKYQTASDGAEKIFPANISKQDGLKIKTITQKIYQKCGFSGIIRVDYILADNKIYVNEINSVPGSMAYYLFCNTVKEFTNVLTLLINDAISNFRRTSALSYHYFSKVLDISGVKGKKTTR